MNAFPCTLSMQCCSANGSYQCSNYFHIFLQQIPCSVCSACTACAGNAVAEVDRSLVYCMKHSIADDDHTPCHKRPVFHPGLVQRWHEAYADKFPELASSTGLARKVCDSPLPASCTSGGSHVGLFACSRCPWIDSCCVGPRFTCACP